jgi:hypothetical protein
VDEPARAHLAHAMPWFGLPDEGRYVDLLVDQTLGDIANAS